MSTKRNIGVLMDSILDINPTKDTTLGFMIAAQKRGHVLHYIERDNLCMKNSRILANSRQISVTDDKREWFKLGAIRTHDISDLDILLMRLDPPFNMSYIFTTYLLEHAQNHHNLRVINNPASLRNHNEKLFAIDFPTCCPPTLVSAQFEQLREFIATYQDVILKPLDGMGGHSIFRVQSDGHNNNVILETMLDKALPIMAQQYLPEIQQGDKRILLIEGKPVPHALVRTAIKGETRANLATGGKGEVCELTKRDYEICETLGARMVELGLIFVGLDVIGNYLTEINITSPTGVREIERATGKDISGQIIEASLASSTISLSAT